MKNTGSALVSRLRKIEDAPEAAPKLSVALKPEAKKTRPANKEAGSILTPSYLMATATIKNVTVQCELADELKERLPAILAKTSPFSTPLGLSKLIDLMYCEVMASESLKERMLSKATAFVVVLKGNNRTSINVPEYIADYIQATFKAGSQKAFTAFVAWIVRDWAYIQAKIKLKGLC